MTGRPTLDDAREALVRACHESLHALIGLGVGGDRDAAAGAIERASEDLETAYQHLEGPA